MHDFADRVIADRYALERELGRGGMATVWLARDLRHDRPVAIKIIHPELAGAIGVDRFVREIRLTARLQHPSIVAILDSGTLETSDGTSLPWYAMPYLEGESLRTRLTRERQLPVEEALHIAEAVGAALSAAHELGIVHRDIKPENVFLSAAQVYVVDFGIAKALIETGGDRLTSTGLAIGTPAYMSPEQAMADRIDARSDQYSLATVLYEMLSGEPPFTGPTAHAILARRLTEPARPLMPVRPTVPAQVERAVLRALERVPADRFPGVSAFTAALRRDSPPGLPHPFRRLATSRVVVAAGLLVAVGAGAGVLTSRGRVPGPRARDPEVVALYQRGLRGYDRRTPAGIVEAITAFNAAIRLDSTYPLAWTGLAKSYVRADERDFTIPGVPQDSVLHRAVAAADRALALDSTRADAWLTLSMVTQRIDPTDLRPQFRAVRQAIRLDSTNAPAWHTLARATAESGDLAGALQAWRRCVTLDPTYTQCVVFMAQAHYWRREYDSAAVWADSTIALDPSYLTGRGLAGYIALERGEFARAAAAFDAARRLSTAVEVVNALAGKALVEVRAGRGKQGRIDLRTADSLAAAYTPPPPHTAVYLSQAYAALGDSDRALAWLERFATPGDLHFQVHLRCDPPFDPIRGSQRFRALLVVPSPPPGLGC